MAWLHGWAGLVVVWVLIAIFVTVAASDDRADISRLMRPGLARAAPMGGPALGAAAEHAVANLARHAPKARTWVVGLPQPNKPVGPLVGRAVAVLPQRLERLTVVDHGDAKATLIALFAAARMVARTAARDVGPSHASARPRGLPEPQGCPGSTASCKGSDPFCERPRGRRAGRTRRPARSRC